MTSNLKRLLYRRISISEYMPRKNQILSESLLFALQQLPEAPGVYQYFNSAKQLLYVGKAKNLKKRVSSYFNNKNQSPWTQLMITEINSLQITTVKTELEALFLENNFIKSLKPVYNIQLRDDKTYPYLKITNELLPRFTIVRKVNNDKARYYGPFISGTYLYSLLALLQQMYGIRTAKETSYEARSSVPIQIGLGARNLDNQTMYQQNVEEAIKFIQSPQPKMEQLIKNAMTRASQSEQFELAAQLRNKLKGLEQLRQEQTLHSPSSISRDYLGIACRGNLVAIHQLIERESKIVANHTFIFTNPLADNMADLTSYVIPYIYMRGIPTPQEIIVSVIKEEKLIEQFLKEQSGNRVKILAPSRGDLHKKVIIATENADYQLHLESLKKSRRTDALRSLTQVLKLKKTPKRIEACDISNLGATNIVGATIVFIDGQPAKSEYRKYKIKTPHGQDDFASMRELVFRRLSNKDRPLPDLLLIDGGKGQLTAALDALKLANITLPLIALAKKEELIFKPNEFDPLRLKNDDPARLLLEAIRNEVHRFVIAFHRQRRSKSLIK